jgi:signal transduction histidine kinase
MLSVRRIMTPQSSVAFVTALVYLLLALIIWRRRGEGNPIALALGGYLILFIIWGIIQGLLLGNWFVLMGGLDFSSLLIFSVGLIGFTYLDLTRRFLQQPALNILLWIVVFSLVGGQIAFEVIQPPLNVSLPFSLSNLLIIISTVLWVFLTAATFELTIRKYRLKDNPLHRNRLSYWAVTLIFITLGEAIYALNNTVIGNILLLLGAFNAFFVITTHRHPDIRLGILRVLSFVMITFLIVVVYTLVYMTVQFIVQERMGSSPLIAGAVMALVLAIIFRPLFWQIQKNIQQTLGRVDTDSNQTIREYSLSISNIINMEQLAIVSTGLISEAFDTRRGMLILVNQVEVEGEEWMFRLDPVEGGMGVNPPPSFHLSPESTIAVFLSTQHRPLIQYDIDFMPLFSSVPPKDREWFSSLGMDVYSPIYSKGIWIGLLAVGPKETGVPYSEMELNLMSTLTDQTSVALENARLVEGILQVNLQLEQAFGNLERTKDELERLDKAKSDFISIASHELRTPLTVIQGYTQMLEEDSAIAENAYHKNLLEGIASGTERLHSIVDNMLDVAKIDGRELQLAPVPIPIYSIIKSVCRTMTSSIEQRKLKLELADLSTLRPIEVDREAIQKVFYNLVNNAIKYTPDGGMIAINGRMLTRDNEVLPTEGIEIIIKDSGIGIDPDYQALIFQKFFRTGELGLHSSGKTKFKGAGPGLGLAIAQGIVEAHSGRIWVESEGYDETNLPGSQFYVALPVRQFHPDSQRSKPA